MNNQSILNKINCYVFIILVISQTIQLKAAAVTIDGLKKLITKFADEDKSYITLYAAELGLDYDNYLAARRKQDCLEIKNYVLMFSPTLTSEALAGKIDQDKLDWVNNNCPGILPQASSRLPGDMADTSPSATPDTAKTSGATNNIPVTQAAVSSSTQTPAPANTNNNKNNSFNSFHQLKND